MVVVERREGRDDAVYRGRTYIICQLSEESIGAQVAKDHSAASCWIEKALDQQTQGQKSVG